MKRHINLLYTKDAYHKAIKLKRYFRLGAVILGLGVFLAVGASLLATYSINRTYDELIVEKEYLLKEKNEYADVEAQINAFNRRAQIIKSATSKEQPFLGHLQVLDEYFPQSTAEADISTVTIDKDGKVKLEVIYTSKESLMNFLEDVEYGSLSRYYKEFRIDSLGISGGNLAEISMVMSGIFTTSYGGEIIRDATENN